MERAELIDLVRATGCAEEYEGFVFLVDPKWGRGERDALALVAQQAKMERRKNGSPEGWLCLPTGGTSGGLRFARHDEHTLSAAVRGFCAHFGLTKINAVDVLPSYHVSGLMARVRCADTGGKHVAWDWKRLEAGERPDVRTNDGSKVISLVPTQLQRLLPWPDLVTWLRSFDIIFIGGGPLWPELAAAAAAERLPLSLSYGMTETAAMVAALRPPEFLAGVRSCGTALPHVQIAVNPEGILRIRGESVHRGYFPHTDASRTLTTEDLGFFDERGHLHILGRRDAVIITGGKKVDPWEVELALRASGEFTEVAVVGVPDSQWGETVIGCYLRETTRAPNFERSMEKLAAYQRPKRFVALDNWPRNTQGKVNRAALRAAAMPSASGGE